MKLALLIGLLAAAAYAEDPARTEIARQLDEGLISGAVFGRVGEEPWTAGWLRFSSARVPMRADARFDVASITKPVTAAVTARLVEAGKIDPDALFTDYLPEHVLAKETHRIRVRDLAMHTSGFCGYDPGIREMSGEAFFRGMMTVRPTLAYGRYSYSCLNFVLLGRIVEKVTGLRLDRAAEDLLFRPLGMADSSWGPVADDGRVVEMPIGVERGRRIGEVVDMLAFPAKVPLGNAGLFTTFRDLGLFLEDLRLRKRFGAAYYDLLTTPVADADGNLRTFGFDMRRGERPRGASAKAFFHTGSTGQSVIVDPVRGLSAMVLTGRKGAHDPCIVARRKALEAYFPPAERPRRIVAFGDSITEGVIGIRPEENWLRLLQNRLGDDFVTFNAGVGGNSAREAMARYERDVLARNPDLVIIEFGGNNTGLQDPSRRVDDAEFVRHLTRFRDGLPKGCAVVAVTFPPLKEDWHRVYQGSPTNYVGDVALDSQRQIVRDFARQNGWPLVDLYAILKDRHEKFVLKDGVHLNADGQEAFADAVFDTLRKMDIYKEEEGK